MSPATIGGLFAKEVSRPIEGVIKADDTEHLATEIDEYVLTGETAAALSDFLEAYTAPVYGGGNGVWISGFFGSGKSHLLKMLAHLLGDVPGTTSERQRAVEAFCAKAEGDAMLGGLLTRAARIPATSLLFNIDQKAPLIDKNQTDALLQVFVKVFNEARGYYAGEPSVARFERDLDRRGRLEAFKETFAEVAGVLWEQGREEGILQEHNVTETWSRVTGEVGTANILARYEEQYSLSIEDFADEVAQWLATQSADHRLLFMVDEVGQFIGSSTKLMLNLQTIAETLSTTCRGRAWVCVTSQEDMDGVIGDRTRTQGNDFSKIQARFATRMKLTSQDVEEVIEKRLLGKSADGEAALDPLYEEHHANFRTLFNFVDGSKTYRSYEGREGFVRRYPFVPYQFPLFQAALVGLSDHNVFEGRHASVGERSMLGVVQSVVKDRESSQVGTLVPFDAMFAGIRQTVKSAATRNITTAQTHLEPGPVSEMAVRLLKALFLVKYVNGFHATARNLAILVRGELGEDLTALDGLVTQALDLLERETYVQRNGTAYEYLTNEEQDVEQEIKSTNVDAEEVSKVLADIIKEDITRILSVRHEPTGRDFTYELRLDESPYSRAQPLAVHYISSALGQKRDVVLAQSMGRDELRVLLADDRRMYQDLRLYVQTDKYVRLRSGTDQTETRRHILEGKSRQNRERRRELVTRVEQAIAGAELIVSGTSLPVTASDPRWRVEEGVAALIARTYTQLTLIGEYPYSESDIARLISEDPTLLERDTDTLQPAVEEMAGWLMRQRDLGARNTVKQIVDRYEGKPYGWSLAGILCVIARLVATSQVTLTLDSRALKRTELGEALRNGKKREVTIVGLQRRFDVATVQRVRSFAQEFFTATDLPGDPLDLAAVVKERLASEWKQLRFLQDSHAGQYPFLAVLDHPIGLLGETLNHSTEWYLDELPAHTDALLDAKQDAIDPVRHFLKGSQKTIYDDAVRLLTDSRDSLDYLPEDHAKAMTSMLADPRVFRGQGTARLKNATAALRCALEARLDEERRDAERVLRERMEQVHASAAWAETSEEARVEAGRRVARVRERVAAASSVPVIRQVAADFDDVGYTEVLSVIENGRRAQTADDDGPAAASRPQIVPVRRLARPGARLLRTTADADAYVEELRVILHDAIESGKQVSL
ncbi:MULTISPECIES: BREX system P-loop protein BrxC [Actinomyces]|uniref:BREX system P-loop protein BrxC n=1 Tax=Actinomyces respiraculi TaxID=2744574 RepID=A0A7T0PWT4_9ACTO|nr:MULTISPECIES: BREX system P-loop protein BrxC [Actinomyces]QPL04900.1 BREX system P-loop protein BrxC [Actinomyces respiraculi]